jgi:acyl-CoA hydrolase
MSKKHTKKQIEVAKPTETRMVKMVFPNQTNHYSTLFAGEALSMMDLTAFITGSRHSRKSLVTASSEKIDFKVPIKQGQIAEFIGRVIKTGKTSITVEVEMHGEDLISGKRQLSAKGNFVLVAVDKKGRPVSI